MLEYQSPDTDLTLEEGLAEYYASRSDLVGGRGISSDAREFVRCHDDAHVVFRESRLSRRTQGVPMVQVCAYAEEMRQELGVLT